MRGNLARWNVLTPVGRDTLDSTSGYFNDEASAVTIKLDRDEINPIFPLSSKVRQGTFETLLTKRRNKVRI